MAILDRNTILSLNMDPKSLNLHDMAIARMKKVKLNPTARHDFIEDRARTKEITNSDELFRKLNTMEKNGTLDIWIKKFGKKKYMKESIEIFDDILEENGHLVFTINTKEIVRSMQSMVEEMDGASAAGFMGAGAGPAATMAGTPSRNRIIENKYPKTSPSDNKPEGETHQDTNLGGNDGWIKD